jgi:predicted acylesterase/phospholipase RssA
MAAASAQTAQDDNRTHEVRIGLVLYGGVSLAIYIYGVVFEFWRLLKAANGERNEYTDLLDEEGAAVTIDIISGTSAGGINGVLLAKAVATGADLELVRSLWVDGGDFGKLIREADDAEPRSLLRSELFDELIAAGLADMSRNPSGKPLVTALDLFITGTRLGGWLRKYRDVTGQIVETRQHRKAFHLKYRTQGYNPAARELGYNRNDFDAKYDPHLAEIARATSAFPFAFEPMLIERRPVDGEDPRFSLDEPDAEYFSDGGILDNKPFTDTIATIFSREAHRPVRRWLISVEPDPQPAPPQASPGPAPEVTEVVAKALSGIPRAESIAADLESLIEHQRRVEDLKGILSTLDQHLSWFAALSSQSNRRLAEVLGDQALHESYLELRASAARGELVDRLLDCAGLGEEYRKPIEEEVTAVLPTDASVRAVNLGLERRRIRRLLEAVVQLETDNESTLIAGRRHLWGCLSWIDQVVWDMFGLKSDATRAMSRLKGQPDAVVREQVNVVLATITPSLTQKLRAIRLRTARAVIVAGQELSRKADSAAAEAGASQLRLLYSWYELWDLYLLPSERLAGRGERDVIRFFNLSPRATTFVRKSKEDKLAGDALGHFGGFVRREWRDNDILWGRLDAAEAIVDIVRNDPLKQRQDRVQHIRTIQGAIAAEEVRELTGDYRLYLERAYTVGSEDLTAVPMHERAALVMRGSTVLRNMLRRLERAERGGGLRPVLGLLGRVLGFALLLFRWPVRAVWGRDPAVRRFATLLLFGGFLWALATVVLIAIGLIGGPSRQLWIVLAAVSGAFFLYAFLLGLARMALYRARKTERAPPRLPPKETACTVEVAVESRTFKQGDTPRPLWATLRQPRRPAQIADGIPGDPIDLSDVSVVKARLSRGAGAVTRLCAIQQPPSRGVVSAALTEADLAEPGVVLLEFEMHRNGTLETVPSGPPVHIEIHERL